MVYVKRFSASSCAQLMACPGSARLEQSIPGFEYPAPDPLKFVAKGVGDSVHASLEKLAHTGPATLRVIAGWLLDYAQLHITKREHLATDEDEMRFWLIKVSSTSHQHHVTDEWVDWFMQLGEFKPKMLRWMSAVAIYIGDLISTLRPGDAIATEEKLIAEWLPSKPGTTPDLTIVAEDRLEVLDLKSGAIQVSPVMNPQLMFYAACKLHLAPKAKVIKFHILQPAPRDQWNHDDWECTRAELEEWMSEAIEADRRILAEDLTLQPSDYCTFCPANPWSRGEKGSIMCPAQMQRLYPLVFDEVEIFDA